MFAFAVMLWLQSFYSHYRQTYKCHYKYEIVICALVTFLSSLFLLMMTTLRYGVIGVQITDFVIFVKAYLHDTIRRIRLSF